MASLSTVDGLRTAAVVGPAVAFVVTSAAVPVSIRVARRFGVLDAPTDRSSHTVPTPRLGGMAVVLGTCVAFGVAAAISPDAVRASTEGSGPVRLLLAITLVLAGIGLADDLVRGIPVAVRLLGQAVVAFGLVAPWVLSQHPSPATLGSGLTAVGAAFALIGFVNVFNFMDGVDAMSGSVAAVMGLHLALLGGLETQAPLVVMGTVVAGSALGFLPRNLRPTTVFLGDGGSYFLGGWLAAAGIFAVGVGAPPVAVVLVGLPYLADTGTTLVDRVRRRQDWKASHHEHAYQRLVLAGWSHRAVSALVASLTAACGALGLATAGSSPAVQAAAVAVATSISATYVVVSRRLQLAPRRATGSRPGATTTD